MANFELVLPKMGESVAEATVNKWLIKPGDTVSADDTVVEVSTDKVDTEVPSPVTGTVIEIIAQENSVVQVGEVLAIISTGNDSQANASAAASAVTAPSQQIKEDNSDISKTDSIPGISQIPGQPAADNKVIENNNPGSKRIYTPLVKSIAAQEGISAAELAGITGTAADGRITKDDVLNYLKTRGTHTSPSAPPATPAAAQPAAPAFALHNPVVPASASDDVEVIEMDRMRKLIADHMVMSVQTSPHVTSFVQADVTNLVNWRNRVKGAFEKREQEKITFTPLFIEATIKALKDFPMVNISISGNQILRKKHINIGLATALPTGNLIVPVIKQADQFNLIGLTKAVNDLAARARQAKLKPEETQGGTFTITNVGAFGNITGTPIINQPQAAILAVGTITKQPAVLETEYGDVIAIRHIMILSLSYDHRAVDGALGGRFLKRVADYLEQWDVNRIV